MYTTDYNNMLMEIKNKIINENLKYNNSIIIGDNSSGKSELLKMYLNEFIYSIRCVKSKIYSKHNISV